MKQQVAKCEAKRTSWLCVAPLLLCNLLHDQVCERSPASQFPLRYICIKDSLVALVNLLQSRCYEA